VRLVCIGCGKEPAELTEYVVEAESLGMTPNQYVREEEGTLNEANGHFACTDCYIKMGQPSRPAPDRWIAP
jgi:hypothetical protein